MGQIETSLVSWIKVGLKLKTANQWKYKWNEYSDKEQNRNMKHRLILLELSHWTNKENKERVTFQMDNNIMKNKAEDSQRTSESSIYFDSILCYSS